MFVKQLDFDIFMDYFLKNIRFTHIIFYGKTTVVGPVVLQNLIVS